MNTPANFYLSYWIRKVYADGTVGWIACQASGGAFPIGPPDIPLDVRLYAEELDKDLILEDSNVQFSLGSDLKATTGSDQNITLANRDRKYGTIDGNLPFSAFLESPDTLLLELQIRVPQAIVHLFPVALLQADGQYLVWTGFLANSEFQLGGDEVRLEFKDLTYWLGNFRLTTDFAFVQRLDLLAAVKAEVPFIRDTDVQIVELPDVWDMRKYDPSPAGNLTFRLGTTVYDAIEFVRRDADTLWAIAGGWLFRINILTGAITESNVAYNPPDAVQFSRYLFDPAKKGTDSALTYCPYRIKYDVAGATHAANEIPPQDINWTNNNCYRFGINNPLAPDWDPIPGIGIRVHAWNDTTHVWGASVDPSPFIAFTQFDFGMGLQGLSLFHEVIAGSDSRFIASDDYSDRVAVCWHYGGVANYYTTLANLGKIRHYIKGHTIAGVEFPYLGCRTDGSWFWFRVATDGVGAAGTLEAKEAYFTDEAADRVSGVPFDTCYRLHTEKYPNCICYLERTDDADLLVIVNDKFIVQEKLFCGLRTPRSAHKPPNFEEAETARLLTLIGDDFEPASIGVFPQPDAITEEPTVNLMKLTKDTPDYAAYLPISEDGIGKTIAEFAQTDLAWVWLRPDGVLTYKNPGIALEDPVENLTTEVQKDAGDEDAIRYWDQQFNQIICNYGLDSMLKIGTKTWNQKEQQTDLTGVIYSKDYATAIALQGYLIYKPKRQHITSPLYRLSMIELWKKFYLHKDWATIFSKFDLFNQTAELQGITPPIVLSLIFPEIVDWAGGSRAWNNYKVEWGLYQDPVTCLWSYYGQLPVPPPPAPREWFVGDVLGYPGAVCDLLRVLLDDICDDLNATPVCVATDLSDRTWVYNWIIDHIIDYWTQIYEIVTLLDGAGMLGA